MDAVTYPNESVINFINQNVIPLQIPSDAQPLADDFNIKWTPALLVLDQYGNKHQDTVGFFGEDELVPSIMLGIGKLHFNRNEFKEALDSFGSLLTKYENSDSAPEAVFYEAVSLYKSTQDPKPLREAYELLKSKYSASLWTRRAYPYRLIPG